ncbi:MULTISPECIES: hypothetical protein [Saccharothrix]|uniref:hypothetical protein n=1 Tax=Saccharothrix TaxID=2071 RepID=UPI00093DAC80|nr:hypothetical protein [Saccharothrix sp. CB00851]OKI26357.1 hypothetical protein A6A25_32235 [Saccharothrix sp. CB00851]
MLPAPGSPTDGTHDDIAGEQPDPVAAALDTVAERMDRLESAVADFHRRSAHREAIIDRLHDENQTLRAGQRRELLEPLVADLVRLHDGLLRQARHQAGDLLTGFADDVVLTLDRCGVEVVPAVPGEAFESGRHAVGGLQPCEDPTLHNTVAVPLTAGLRDRETGRMRRPAKAIFYRADQTPEA